jgi:sporulation protein YlmC with PRC-barrel domain
MWLGRHAELNHKQTMKLIYKSLLISLTPWLISVPALAEKYGSTEVASGVSDSSIHSKGSTWRASGVIGQAVKNAQDQTIGEIQDIFINMKTGQVLAVVISSGGFLGIADTLSSVPVSALRFDATAKAFKTKLTKEQLANAPQFKGHEWPDYEDAATLQALHSFRESVGGDVTANDNTAQNEKANNRKTMIPTDQGNSEKDIQITKDIRSEVVAAGLSFNAKNIKIITKDEHVYLKGVVENHTEHESILKIAKSHVTATMITDELEMNSK